MIYNYIINIFYIQLYIYFLFYYHIFNCYFHYLLNLYSKRQIYSSVVTSHCANCGCSTPYLFLLTNTKVCRNCLETSDDYLIITKSMALSQFLLTEKDLTSIPKGIIGQKGDRSFMGYIQVYAAKSVDKL